MQNSSKFLKFHFTHYPPYQKDKIVLGQRAVKSLINGHSEKRTPPVNGHALFRRITIPVKIICLTLKKAHTSI